MEMRDVLDGLKRSIDLLVELSGEKGVVGGGSRKRKRLIVDDSDDSDECFDDNSNRR